jgi:hypothetical protein
MECMMETGPIFLKTDDGKIINIQCIRWVKKMNDCMEVCLKSSGCTSMFGDTHKVCKMKNPESYSKIHAYFEE